MIFYKNLNKYECKLKKKIKNKKKMKIIIILVFISMILNQTSSSDSFPEYFSNMDLFQNQRRGNKF